MKRRWLVAALFVLLSPFPGGDPSAQSSSATTWSTHIEMDVLQDNNPYNPPGIDAVIFGTSSSKVLTLHPQDIGKTHGNDTSVKVVDLSCSNVFGQIFRQTQLRDPVVAGQSLEIIFIENGNCQETYYGSVVSRLYGAVNPLIGPDQAANACKSAFCI